MPVYSSDAPPALLQAHPQTTLPLRSHFNHLLQEAQLRPTISRINVLQVFMAHPLRKMNIHDVYRILDSAGVITSMATIQRTLSQLALGGVLARSGSMKRGDGSSLFWMQPTP